MIQFLYQKAGLEPVVWRKHNITSMLMQYIESCDTALRNQHL